MDNINGKLKKEIGTTRNSAEKPEFFIDFPEALDVVSLPEPDTDGGPGLWTTLKGRRSTRRFIDEPISLKELSQLCWAVQGVTANIREKILLRTAPSAGARYPCETYLVVNNVAELDAGFYHYDIRKHQLEFLKRGSFREELGDVCLGQRHVKDAAVVFIWAVLEARTTSKYHDRGYRYICMDAGHIGQNLHLAAEALDFGCCMIGAFSDEDVDGVLGLGSRLGNALYLGAIGKRA